MSREPTHKNAMTEVDIHLANAKLRPAAPERVLSTAA